MVDGALGEAAAHGEAGVPGADDDGGDGTNRRRSSSRELRRGAGSDHLDGDVRRIGDDVIHRRALLRLRDQRLDVFALGVGVDLVADLDAAEAVADVAVDAEDALRDPCCLRWWP